MSNQTNDRLVETAYEILDDMQKYDRVQMELALQRNDLDTVYSLVKKHQQYELYRATVNDSEAI
jgi:hypothetical protein